MRGLSQRDRIIQKATKLFEGKGYHQTSIQDLADAMHLNKATLYHHIESKEGLLFEIHDSFIDHFIKRCEEVCEGHLSPSERLTALIRAHVHLMRDFQPQITVFFQERDHVKRSGVILAKRHRAEDFYTQTLSDGLASGEFRIQNLRVTTFAILGVINWMYQWYRRDGKCSADEIADILIEFIFRGIVARES